MLVLLFLSLLCSVAQSRVTFTTSEVLDDVDLRGSNSASFKCYAGCRVYSPTKNANIVIQDINGKEYTSLNDLANKEPGKVTELPASADLYWLKNKGAANPPFVFYAVEKGATNYNIKVAYVDATQRYDVSPKTDAALTVMSSTGAVRISNFVGDFSDALPSVYAVPADSISSASCRPVFDAYSPSSVLNTAFSVLGPIATINFKKSSNGKTVRIGGGAGLTATGKGVSAVYSSPGYVGCENLKDKDSLYTSLSQITSFSSSFQMSDSNGLTVTVNGDYSIEKEADAIELTVNNDVQKLYGKKPISKVYTDNSFKIALGWEKRAGSTDRFAIQIDVMGSKDNGDSRVSTTTKSTHSITIGSSILMMISALVLRM